MTFQTVPINITGPSYQSRSRALSSQIAQNFYQQFNEAGKEKYVLLSFPGLLPLYQVDTDKPFITGDIIDNLNGSIVLSGGDNLVYNTPNPNF
tara:strand:+ start:2887 stop:3165 length:279 start_codon:yes stop_codon:yes gene_type:complete